MSFEGYSRYICAEGHTTCYGVHCDPHPQVCAICASAFVWERIVDQTNDNGDDPELEVKTSAVRARCNLGHTHITQEATYHIPTDGHMLPVTALETR